MMPHAAERTQHTEYTDRKSAVIHSANITPVNTSVPLVAAKSRSDNAVKPPLLTSEANNDYLNYHVSAKSSILVTVTPDALAKLNSSLVWDSKPR